MHTYPKTPDRDQRAATGILKPTALMLLLLALAASMAFAQPGDCFAETGTSTIWNILDPNPNSVRIEWTFYATGLAGYDRVVRTSSVGGDLTDFANSQCEAVDFSRDADELNAGKNLAGSFNPNADSIQPAYPENCIPVAPAVTFADCRRSLLHQIILREFYPRGGPNDTGNPTAVLEMLASFGDIWAWIETNTQGGGSGFNAQDRARWLDVFGHPNWSEQRMNNMEALASAAELDRNNWPERSLD